MAIDVTGSARTLLNDALAQNDVDMDNHKLLNLDTSNLQELGSPPTIIPPANNWLKAWNNPTATWTHQQINFNNLAGNLTLGVGGQQRAITQLGTIGIGSWQGSVISGTYLAKLNEIRFPTGPVNIGFQRLINLADPVEPFDAVTKQFMDFLLQGLNVHEAVRVATTTRIAAFDLPVVDGVQLQTGDRVLIKNTNPGEEQYQGIWIASPGPATWSLAPDYLTVADMTRTYVSVREGTINASTSWVQVNPITNVLDPKNFVYFTVAGGEQGPPGVDGEGVPPGGDAGQVLSKIDGTNFNTQWVGVPQITLPEMSFVQTGQLNPVGTSQAAGRMMGLAGIITLLSSSKVMCTINGFIWNNNAAGSAAASIRVGTGTAPANGAVPPVGSVNIGGAAAVSRMPANGVAPYSLTCVLGGITPGLPFWFDLLLQCPQGIGLASVGGTSLTIHEIP